MIRRTTTTILAAALATLVTPAVLAQSDTGTADFTEFVALGDSLVAGEVNNDLVETYQENSIPALIYKRVNDVSTAEDFEQPLFEEGGDIGRLALIPPSLIPVRLPDTGMAINTDPSRPFDNMGATGGMRVNDLLTISGLASCQSHPLAMTKSCTRMNETLQDRGTALAQTLEQLPTFVMLWIGGNDALQAVTTATVIEGVTLTPAADFEADYRAVTDAIAAGGADMVLANVVGVPGVPFVNTVPPIVIDPVTREPVLIMGQTVPLLDSSGAPLASTDRVTLFGLLLLDPPFMDGGTGCGVPDIIDGGFDSNVCPSGGLTDEVVLTAAEAAQIDGRIDEYNLVIETVAQETGSALVDAHALFNDWAADGITLGGVEYNLDFLTGGLISYDGIHPAPLANALATNEFILAVNSTYGAQIPLVDLFPFAVGTAGSLAPPIMIGDVQGTVAETFETMRDGLGLPTDDELRLLVGSGPGPDPGGSPRQRSRRRMDRGFR